MRKNYRVIQEGDRFYPEWKYWFWKWRRFYYTKNSDLNDSLFIRNYKTEDEAWEFIKEKSLVNSLNMIRLINYKGGSAT